MYVDEYSVKHARLEVSTNQFRNRLIVNRCRGYFENVLEIDFFLQKHNAVVHFDGRTEYEMRQ